MERMKERRVEVEFEFELTSRAASTLCRAVLLAADGAYCRFRLLSVRHLLLQSWLMLLTVQWKESSRDL